MNNNISAQIKEIRKEKKITLKEMSEKTGLSISFLSQMERGISTITLVSLKKITDVLQVSMKDLFDEAEEDISFIKKSDAHHLHGLSYFAEYHMLSGKFPGRKLECLKMKLNPKSYDCEETSHSGEEFYYILKGCVTVLVDNKRYVLNEGETIHFPSNHSHKAYNDEDQEAEMLCVTYPTIF
jgi:transcriptional regulator with XRE-family HTH domain